MSRPLAFLVALPLAALPLAAQDGRVLELSEVETLPVVQNAADFQDALAAAYPPDLRAAAVGGTVVVRFVVGSDGTVRDPEVVEAAHEGLSAATVEAVRVLRFTPATVGGAPVAVRATLPVEWRASPLKPPSPPDTAGSEEALRRLIGDDPALAAMAAGAYELNQVEEQPRPLNAGVLQEALRREFPPELRIRGIGGTVNVRFLIGADGAVYLPYSTTSTHPDLVEPSLRVIRLLRFRPARVGGRAVHTWVELPIGWNPVSGAGARARGDRDQPRPSRELPLPSSEPAAPRDRPRPPRP